MAIEHAAVNARDQGRGNMTTPWMDGGSLRCASIDDRSPASTGYHEVCGGATVVTMHQQLRASMPIRTPPAHLAGHNSTVIVMVASNVLPPLATPRSFSTYTPALNEFSTLN